MNNTMTKEIAVYAMRRLRLSENSVEVQVDYRPRKGTHHDRGTVWLLTRLPMKRKEEKP